MADEVTAAALSIRERLDHGDMFLQAVSQSDARPWDKFMMRMAYRIPGVRRDVNEFIASKAESEGLPSTMANGDLLKYIIEHLPEIAAFIATLFKLFGGI